MISFIALYIKCAKKAEFFYYLRWYLLFNKKEQNINEELLNMKSNGNWNTTIRLKVKYLNATFDFNCLNRKNRNQVFATHYGIIFQKSIV